jgi:hypothetical protein
VGRRAPLSRLAADLLTALLIGDPATGAAMGTAIEIAVEAGYSRDVGRGDLDRIQSVLASSQNVI